MSYMVGGAGPDGKRSTLGTFETPKDAVERALEAMGQGWADVTIYADGNVYGPAQFGQLFRPE